MDYRISSKSPTEELMILGRLLAEVGDYASTTLDSIHLRLAKSCWTRLDKVLAQLVKREAIETKDDLFDFSNEEKQVLSNFDFQDSTASQLQNLSIFELELLYRFRQSFDKSVEKFKSQQRLGLYNRYDIVLELEKRTPSDMCEQLKTDYCKLTFQNELDYSSFLLEAPIGDLPEYNPMDRTRKYTSDELLALIRSYSGYWRFKTVMQKLMLEQYIEYSMDFVDDSSDILAVAPLIAGIARENSSLGHSYTPWVNQKLQEVVELWEKKPSITDLYMVPVMYALHYNTKGWKYEREAKKILAAAYKESLLRHESIEEDIDYICTVAENLNMSYRYSIRKLLARWTEVCRQVIALDIQIVSNRIVRLLNAAKEIGIYEPVPDGIPEILLSRLAVMAEGCDLIAQIYFRHKTKEESEVSDYQIYEPQYIPVSFDNLMTCTS